jgi:Putative prokaryotic signal transducing protein
VRLLLSSTDLALVQSASLALQSAGIATVVQNEPGGTLPFLPSAIFVDERDFDRARTVVEAFAPRRLEVFQPVVSEQRTWRKSLIVLLILAGILCVGWLLY